MPVRKTRSGTVLVDRRWLVAQFAALICSGIAFPAGPSQAAEPGDQADAPVARLGQLLAKIKAQHPGARILSIARGTGDLEGDLITFEVKLLSRDGRILRQVYDARSLEPAAPERNGHVPGPLRRRERHRGHW